MTYEGVKYKTKFINNSHPNNPGINELRYWCDIFNKKRLAPAYQGGTHGNMSFRIRSGHPEIVITAARTSFAKDLSDDSFFTIHEVDFKTLTVFAQGAKNREPSSETLLHFAIYQTRPDVSAILHGHCESITQKAEKMGIAITGQFVESGTLKIVESVLEVLGQNNFLEIRDHGFLTLGRSIREAGELALEMLKKANQSHTY